MLKGTLKYLKRIETSTPKGCRDNYIAHWSEKGYIISDYVQLEVVAENMDFIDSDRKLTKMITDKVERNFQRGKDVIPIIGFENTLTINQKKLMSIFGLTAEESIDYIVAHYVLKKQQKVIMFGSNPFRLGMDIIVGIFVPLEDETGVSLYVYQVGLDHY